jgi:hypothetical protein
MANYRGDRSFTDYVHVHLARPVIYEPLGWQELDLPADLLKRIDQDHGIDYVVRDRDGRDIRLQERFRESKYQNYTDATLRFRRDQNRHQDRVKSEFYKIEADYLVYGITNGTKELSKRAALTDFLKWVVLDLKLIQQKIKQGKLIIVSEKANRCYVKNERLYCPENFNADGSSSFVPLDIKLIRKLWGDEPIFAQRGYLH